MYYYQYKFVSVELSSRFTVWNYAQQITNILKSHYNNDLEDVCFGKNYYDFTITREKNKHEQSTLGKKIAAAIPEFEKYKQRYTFTHADTNKQDISTRIFKENTDKRRQS